MTREGTPLRFLLVNSESTNSPEYSMPITRIGPTSTPSTVKVPSVTTAQRHPSSLLPVKSARGSSFSTSNGHRHGFISHSTTDTDESTSSSSSSSSDIEDGSADVVGSDDDDDDDEQGEGEGYFTQRKRSRKKVKRRKRFRGTGTAEEDELLDQAQVRTYNGGVYEPSIPSPKTAAAATKPPIDYLALATERRRSSLVSTPPAAASLLSSSNESLSTRRQSGSTGGVLSGLGKVGLVGRGISVADIKDVEPSSHSYHPHHQPPSPTTSSHSVDSNPRRTSLNILSGGFDLASIRRDPTDLGTQYAIDAGVTAHADLGGRGKHEFGAYSRGHGKRQSVSSGLAVLESESRAGATAGGERPQVKTAQSGYFSSLNQARVAEQSSSGVQPGPQSQTSPHHQPQPQQQQQQQGEINDLTPVARTGTLPSSAPLTNSDTYTIGGAGMKTVTSSPVASTSRTGISLQRIPSFNEPGGGIKDHEHDHDHDIPPPCNPRKHRPTGGSGGVPAPSDASTNTGAGASAGAGVLLSRVRAHPGGRGEYGLLAEPVVRHGMTVSGGERRRSGMLGLEIEDERVHDGAPPAVEGAEEWGVSDNPPDNA